MDLCIATLQLERRVVALRHLDSFITSMFSQVTAIRRRSDECVLCTRNGSATLCIWILQSRINGAICTRQPDPGLRADTNPDSMSLATSATGYCRAEIKGPRRRIVSNARREDRRNKGGRKRKGTRAKSSLSNRPIFRRYSLRWERDEMRCKWRQWKTEACRGVD